METLRGGRETSRNVAGLFETLTQLFEILAGRDDPSPCRGVSRRGMLVPGLARYGHPACARGELSVAQGCGSGIPASEGAFLKRSHGILSSKQGIAGSSPVSRSSPMNSGFVPASPCRAARLQAALPPRPLPPFPHAVPIPTRRPMLPAWRQGVLLPLERSDWRVAHLPMAGTPPIPAAGHDCGMQDPIGRRVGAVGECADLLLFTGSQRWASGDVCGHGMPPSPHLPA